MASLPLLQVVARLTALAAAHAVLRQQKQQTYSQTSQQHQFAT